MSANVCSGRVHLQWLNSGSNALRYGPHLKKHTSKLTHTIIPIESRSSPNIINAYLLPLEGIISRKQIRRTTGLVQVLYNGHLQWWCNARYYAVVVRHLKLVHNMTQGLASCVVSRRKRIRKDRFLVYPCCIALAACSSYCEPALKCFYAVLDSFKWTQHAPGHMSWNMKLLSTVTI